MIRTAGSLGALSALGLALAGCPDALRLDMGPDGGTSTGGQGADAGAKPCDSNTDCVYPEAVCDAVKRQCVECLAPLDCLAKPGTVCSAGRCACQSADESFCPERVAERPSRCVDLKTAQTDCGACGHACFGGCSAGACAGGWEVMSLVDAPSGRAQHVAVWDDADSAMIVWGGRLDGGSKATATGGIYDLASNSWSPTSPVDAPAARFGATAVWDSADKLMIVWGGQAGPLGIVNTGALFDPKTNTWTPLPTEGAPSARVGHTAVWDETDKLMIVWGGSDGSTRLNTGGIFDMKTRTWRSIATPALSGRSDHSAVWTGSSMRIWGGQDFDPAGGPIYLSDGADYVPGSDAWTTLEPAGAPSPRFQHAAVATPTAMLVWGGTSDKGLLSDGAKYESGVWSPLNPMGTPEARRLHAAVWVPATSEMIVWGGQGSSALLDTGYRYLDASSTWKPIPTALGARSRSTAVLAGSKIIFWGGDTAEGPTNTGGIFDAAAK